MSLIAWYPLNGDTKDYSGTEKKDLKIYNDFISNDNGKIGKCFSANSRNAYAQTEDILLDGDQSMCVWFNLSAYAYSPTAIVTLHDYTVPANLGINLADKNVAVSIGYGDDREWNRKGTTVIELNKWYHAAITYQKSTNILTLYVNGNIEYKVTLSKKPRFISRPLTLNRWSVYYTDYATTSKFNDVRLYDETLSSKQIKEIAQAKICHYTFNEEMYENTVNLYNNKNQLSSNGPDIAWEDTHTCSFEILEGTLYNGMLFNMNLTLKPLTTYTLSYKFKKLAGKLKQIRGHVQPSSFEQLGVLLNNKKYDSYSDGISITDCYDVYEIQFTFRTKENITSMNYIYIQPNAMVSDYVKVRIWDIQVEEKDHATPFTPNSRTQTLKDISGYNHHMTTYTEYSPIWKQDKSDIRIKGYSTLSDKASFYCENFKYKYPDAFTFSCWIKTTDDEAFCVLGFPMGNNTNFSMAIKDGMLSLHSYNSSPYANNDQWYTTSKKAINDNIWHLLTVVYNGTTAKSYIDGEYETSSTVTFDFQRHPVQHLSINIASPTSNFGDYETRRFNGDISDVKIYATALSDEDIKLLYQPEINIDKSNVIRCSEINEKEMILLESIKIVSAGYGAHQGKYKVSIGDKYSTTEKAVGWCVTSIDIDKNIIHRTFRTHGVSNEFTALKNYVDKLPLTSTILLSTYDQPSAGNTANDDANCKNWIDYLRNLGATQIDGSFIYRAAYAAIIQERKIIAENVHNTGTDAIVTLTTDISLKINKQGFNKNASIVCNEFNEIPDIKSGVHNLRLGNENLPVLIDMDKDGGRWARIFYHNCKYGTVLFSGDNSCAEAKETNKNAPTTSDKYSILSKLEHFRPNTKASFEFRLKYPTDTNDCNIWKQTSNPTYQKVTGYVPVQIKWISDFWGGLEYNGDHLTFIDGSVNHDNWYYAIGTSNKYGNGIPSGRDVTGSSDSTANDVELWVRINNYDLFDNLVQNVSISRDGVLIAKEFREI